MGKVGQLMAYAENTQVPVERSKAEIERTLARYGADEFGYATAQGRAMIRFKADERFVRFTLTMPRQDDKEFTRTDTGRARAPAQAEKEWERACRQRWRALALVVKAKLEAVETGITTFEEEFMAHILLPDGSTVGETALPSIAMAYETGSVQTLLPGPEKR